MASRYRYQASPIQASTVTKPICLVLDALLTDVFGDRSFLFSCDDEELFAHFPMPSLAHRLCLHLHLHLNLL